MAQEGRRVLLVSTDPAHNLGHLFKRTIGPDRVRVAPNFDAMELDPERTVDEHLREVGAALRRLMPERLAGEIDRHMALSRMAPGMQEAAILERIAEVVEEADDNHDLVVFDTAPSGHTARLMALPEMMSAWTEGLLARQQKAERFGELVQSLGQDRSVADKVFGEAPDEARPDRNAQIRRLLYRRRQRFAGLREALADHQRTAFVIVLAAERLAVLESLELHAQLDRAGVAVGGLVVNKRSPADKGEFLAQRRRQEEEHLKAIRTGLPGLPWLEIELASTDIVSLGEVEGFVARLS